MRIYALSDIHVDYPENIRWVRNLSNGDYYNDILILAGDVTHDLKLLEETFNIFLMKFRKVYFVPGNHELWVHNHEYSNSLEKFHHILKICGSLGIHTKPEQISETDASVYIVPLFSWYTKPEEGPDSLYKTKDKDDPSLQMWTDNYLIKWPRFDGTIPTRHFLDMNEEHLSVPYDGPVISFSHFLPRQELMFRIDGEKETNYEVGRDEDFNFSRVAGSTLIENQIRRLGSQIHVYGHQHRNRNRCYDGVTYISCCLGYLHERQDNYPGDALDGPELIWSNES